MNLPPFDPTAAWEKVQCDLAQRQSPVEIADFITNTSPWAQSQNFLRLLCNLAGLKKSHHLLDAGCATGQLGFAAACYTGCRVTMLDYSEPALAFCQDVAQELYKRGNRFEAVFVRDNLMDLSIKKKFDIVANQGVIEHWLSKAERLHVLKQMVKVTKPGGVVVVWVPNLSNAFYRKWIEKVTEVPELAFTVQELRELLVASGLEQVRVLPIRGYSSLNRYLTVPKGLSGILWVLETSFLKLFTLYMHYLGSELVGVGKKRADAGESG